MVVISESSLSFVTGDSPESLVSQVNKLGSNGEKILSIGTYGNRHIAYIIKPKEIKPVVLEKKKQTKKGV